MQAFKFPLDRLLRLKKQLRRQAEVALRKSAREVSEARQHLLDLEERLKELSREMTGAVQSHGAAAAWFAGKAFGDRIDVQIEKARVQVRDAESEYDKSRRQHTKISVEVEALDTLRKQSAVEHKKKRGRYLQHAADARLLAKWNSAASSGERVK